MGVYFLRSRQTRIAPAIYQKIMSRVKYRPLKVEQFCPGWHGPQARKNCNGKPSGKVSEMVDMTYIRHSQLAATNNTNIRINFRTVGFKSVFILSYKMPHKQSNQHYFFLLTFSSKRFAIYTISENSHLLTWGIQRGTFLA
jgi:hypothetical protein